MPEAATEQRSRLYGIDRRLDVLVFIAALMSIPVAAQPGELSGTLLAVDIIAWLIFVFEAVVKIRTRGRQAYLRNRWNWIDLGIIVLSAPYHLATGVAIVARLGSLARLARLLRLALVLSKVLYQGRRLLSRRNVPAAGALVALASFGVAAFVFVAERDAEGGGYETYWDALWWSIVTLTTVGYGDLSPTTTGGRLGAVVLMIVGVAFLGTVAAALASLFVDAEEHEPDSELALLRAEVADLRRSIDTLAARLDDPVR